EETINLRYLEEKPNVQVLGHECIQGTKLKNTSGDEVDDSPLNSADKIFQKEIARLKGQNKEPPLMLRALAWGLQMMLRNFRKERVQKQFLLVAYQFLLVASQEEMQQFKFQNVWILVDFPEGKYAIGTKWILKNKRDARGIVVRNKARLVAQGHRQEEGIDYDEIFKYLKGQPKLGLWYPRESPFMLKAYSDSDYAGTNKDRKSTTGVVVPKYVAGLKFPEDSSLLLTFGVRVQACRYCFSRDIPLICVYFSSILVKTQSSRFKTKDLSRN
nr:ribonuclease H-like domain, reverse transcriptase, RNA-dependent DNA polymerase [Tanacetum cinerariifolium]